MNETEKAEKIVRDLEEEHEALIGRTAILKKQSEQLSFAAKTGDKSAKAKLHTLNVEISTKASEIENLTAALAEAKSRLGTAEDVEARKADQAKAVKIQELQTAFVERLLAIHHACEDMRSVLVRIKFCCRRCTGWELPRRPTISCGSTRCWC